MARSFTSTTDKVACAIGACGLQGGALQTMAAIMRRTSNGVLGVIFYVGSATSGDARSQFAVLTTNNLQLRLGNGTASSTFTVTVSDGWVLAAVTKNDVNPATVRFHKYVYTTNTWTHADSASMLGDSTHPSNSLAIGNWSDASLGFPLPGDIDMAGIWNYNMSDAQVESLPFDLAAWYAPAVPRGMWRLDQDSTSQKVIDMTGGGANQSLVTGTAVSTASTPMWTPGAPLMAMA